MNLKLHFFFSMVLAGASFAALRWAGASDTECFFGALGVMCLYWIGFGLFYSDGKGFDIDDLF